MSEQVDIFGTDDLFADTSDPVTQMNDIKDYLDNTVEPDVKNNTSSDDWFFTVWDGSDERVQVDDCEGCPGCSGYDLAERRDTAESWLSNNFDYYDFSSVCVVVDFHDECPNGLLGVSDGGGWNTNGQKTVVINTAQSLSDDPASNWGQIAAHEIGHTLNAEHQDTAVYYNSGLGYYSATHMWTPPIDGTSTECDNGDETDALDDSFSSCAFNEIDQVL